MTPPWLRPFDYSSRLTLGLPDDAQMGAQRYRGPLRSRPTQTPPAAPATAPVAPTPDPQAAPAASPAPTAPAATPATQARDVQTCNLTLHIDPAHPENNRATPRDSFRLCGASIDDHLLVNGLGVLTARGINLPDAVIGPEYPNDVGLRADFAIPHTSLIGYARFLMGPYTSDGAPDREGWTTRVDLGIRNYGRSPYRGGFGSGGNELGIGVGVSSMEGIDGAVPRFFYYNRSDLISYTHKIGEVAVRASLSVFQGDGSINFSSGPEIAGRTGLYNHLGDLYAISNFIPLRLSLSVFWNPPSSPSDVIALRPGERIPLSRDDIALRIAGRATNEIMNFRRRESGFIFTGAQLGAAIQGSRDLTALTGVGQGFMGLVEGGSRGSDAAAMGDLARHEAGDGGRIAIVGAEAGLTLAYMLASVASPSFDTEGDRVMSESGFGSLRTGRWMQLGQTALTALDAFGLTGNPEDGGALFHGSNAAAAALGLLFILVPRSIAGYGYVNNAGLLDNSVFGDVGPFFDGTRGDVRRTDFVARREAMNVVSTTGVMSLSYALSREFTALGYAIDRGTSSSNAPTTPAAAQDPAARPQSHAARRFIFGMNLLAGGAMFDAGLHW